MNGNIANLKFLLRSLAHRNYRLFFVGQGISLVGSWMQIIALSWLVYRMTNSAFLLGIVGFASQIPTFILAPFAGVLADHWRRRSILVVTQVAAMLQAFILAALALTGAIQVWHIIALSTLLGLINAFDVPARQAFVVDLIEKRQDLGNAIALNSLTFNGARLVGPSLAGILVAVVGEGVCFLINGISFLAVIFALLAMKIDLKDTPQEEYSLLERMKEGLFYTFNHVPIRRILTIVTLMSLLGMSYVVLMPVFAKDILGGGAETLGFLMGSLGVGALGGAVYLASRKNVSWAENNIFVSTLGFSLALAAFSFSRNFWLSLILILSVGFSVIVQISSCNIMVQTMVDDDKRGRVMSFYMMSFLGMAPFGSLLAGSLASRIGAPHTLLLSALMCLLALPLIRRPMAS